MSEAPDDPIQRIEREELARGHIRPGETPVAPRPAATVVLVRASGETPGSPGALEVLLLRRPERSRFAAGAWVFPGGTIDPGDAAPKLLARLAPAHAAVEGPALAAGLRELFEETGILPADRPPAAEEKAAARRALLADRADFAEVAERLGVTFRELEVAYFARWITPEKLTRRYDTRFFLARDRDGTPELTEEHTEARWMTPRDAVAGFRAGRLPMLFPTWKTLEALARFEGLEAALEALAAREVRPIRAGLEVRGDRVVPTMTPDPLYDDPPGEPRSVGPGLRVLVADNPGPLTLDGTRTWIVGTSRPVILDPGPDDPEQAERVVRAVRGRAPEAVCLTHAHPDHAGCAAEVAGRLGVPLLASAETLRRLSARAAPAGPTRAVGDGDTVPVDGGESALEALETPGHSNDHLCWLRRPGGDLFTGDLVLGEGSSLVVHPDGEVGAYLASLARLIALRPGRLLPGHGPPVEDAVGLLEEYRRHRLARDGQVRRALAGGAVSLPELREAVYGDVPPGLQRPAELSLLAHLAHLEATGERLPGGLRRALRESAEAPGAGTEDEALRPRS